MRTHFCGLVCEALIGQTVTLCGWADVARNLGGVCFIDLRDHEGIVQVVADPDTARGVRGRRGRGLRVLPARDRHRARAAQRQRASIATGKVEVDRREDRDPQPRRQAAVLFAREPGRGRAPEVPLPRPAQPGDAAQACASASRWCRRCAVTSTRAGFQDIETPILTKATPEGARDYLVPSRVHAGRVLRVAAVAAAVQAAADDGRHGPLLPDRALLPRRGPARRSPAGIHPARHGVRLRHRARHPGLRRER